MAKSNNWLEQNYEKLVLGVVALVCLAFGVWHILNAMSFEEGFPEVSGDRKSDIPDPPETTVVQSTRLLAEDQVWRDTTVELPGGFKREVPLFVSVPIVEHNNKLYDMLDPNEDPLRPPVSNEWLIENNLDYLSQGVLERDADNDGYSNLEEWKAKTSPIAAESHPPYTDKLAFLERGQRNQFLKFAANNHPQYQINMRPGGSAIVKVGESFGPGGRFTVLNYEEKEGLNNLGIRDDLSELTIRDNTNDKEFILVRQEEKNWPTYAAKFNFALDSKGDFIVKEGDTFTLSKQPDQPYRLEEVKEDEAIISPVDSEETITIPKGKFRVDDGGSMAPGEGGLDTPGSDDGSDNVDEEGNPLVQ